MAKTRRWLRLLLSKISVSAYFPNFLNKLIVKVPFINSKFFKVHIFLIFIIIERAMKTAEQKALKKE